MSEEAGVPTDVEVKLHDDDDKGEGCLSLLDIYESLPSSTTGAVRLEVEVPGKS